MHELYVREFDRATGRAGASAAGTWLRKGLEASREEGRSAAIFTLGLQPVIQCAYSESVTLLGGASVLYAEARLKTFLVSTLQADSTLAVCSCLYLIHSLRSETTYLHLFFTVTSLRGAMLASSSASAPHRPSLPSCTARPSLCLPAPHVQGASSQPCRRNVVTAAAGKPAVATAPLPAAVEALLGTSPSAASAWERAAADFPEAAQLRFLLGRYGQQRVQELLQQQQVRAHLPMLFTAACFTFALAWGSAVTLMLLYMTRSLQLPHQTRASASSVVVCREAVAPSSGAVAGPGPNPGI